MAFWLDRTTRKFFTLWTELQSSMETCTVSREVFDVSFHRNRPFSQIHDEFLNLIVTSFILPFDQDDLLDVLSSTYEIHRNFNGNLVPSLSCQQRFQLELDSILQKISVMFVCCEKLKKRQARLLQSHAAILRQYDELIRILQQSSFESQEIQWFQFTLLSLLRLADILRKIGVKYV